MTVNDDDDGDDSQYDDDSDSDNHDGDSSDDHDMIMTTFQKLWIPQPSFHLSDTTSYGSLVTIICIQKDWHNLAVEHNTMAHLNNMNLKWLEAWLDMDEGMDGMIVCVVI